MTHNKNKLIGGVLAIAALKLGAASALGVDNDPQAVVASRDNAQKNEIDQDCFVITLHDTEVDQAWAQSADIVVANILANPLIDLAPKISAFLKPGGTLLLAGLLEDQAEAVADAYAPIIAMNVQTSEEGWCLLVGSSLSQ